MSTRTNLIIRAYLEGQKPVKQAFEKDGSVFFELYESDFSRIKRFIDSAREDGSIIYGESNSMDAVLEYRPTQNKRFKLTPGLSGFDEIIDGLRSGLAALHTA